MCVNHNPVPVFTEGVDLETVILLGEMCALCRKPVSSAFPEKESGSTETKAPALGKAA